MFPTVSSNAANTYVVERLVITQIHRKISAVVAA